MCLPEGANAYFRADETDVKVVFSLPPRVVTTVMIATEMPAAMRPYSMAVAPDSSFANLTSVFMTLLLRSTRGCLFELGPTTAVVARPVWTIGRKYRLAIARRLIPSINVKIYSLIRHVVKKRFRASGMVIKYFKNIALVKNMYS